MGDRLGKGRERSLSGAEHWQGSAGGSRHCWTHGAGPLSAGCGQALSCTGQLHTLVHTLGQPMAPVASSISHSCSTDPRAAFPQLSQGKLFSPAAAGHARTPGDGTEPVTRSALPCEARCRRTGSPRRGKAFDLTTSPRAACRTPLPLWYLLL